MKKTIFILNTAMILSLFPAAMSAQIKPGSGEISGYMVGEYYYNASHHTEDGEGRHGFWFRRIYFTYDNTLSETIQMRFRLETASPGQWTTSTLLIPWVKDAYFQWAMGKGVNLVAGIQSPPSFSKVESIWGYRSLEKTPLDLYGWTSSRDFGITLKGGNTVPYHVMVANGSSNKAEINRGKKLYGALGYKTGKFFIEAMAQYELVKTGDDDIIGQVFGAYSGAWGRIGLQYSYRSYSAEGSDRALPFNVTSAFVIFQAGKDVELIARWDCNFGDGYKSSFQGSKVEYVPFADDHEFSFLIGAVSWQAHRNVWLIPNLKYTRYRENEELNAGAEYIKPDNDVYLNLTLWFKF